MRFEVLPDLEAELVHAERLGEVVDGAKPHCLDGGARGRVRRHHERDDVAIDFLGRAQHVNTAHIGHLDVGKEQVEIVLA
jgi:hypothetical protein